MTHEGSAFLKDAEGPALSADFSPRASSVETHPGAPRTIAWIEILKACALLWIFLDHVAEQRFGLPLFANPGADWPPLAQRISQFVSQPAEITGSALWVWLVKAFRDVSWMGDQGVSVFLLLSGLTLTLSCLRSNRLSWKQFYGRRLLRIYPIWITAHLLFLVPFAVIGIRLTLLDPRLYWSLFGIRVLPDQLYYGNSAWWFVTLLLQLYLVFPLLWVGLKRWGPVRFALLTGGAALVVRGAGLLFFHDYLDAWARGSIFITRLPEFALGMSLGTLFFGHAKQTQRRVSRGIWIGGGIVSLCLGLASSFTLLGMTIAPLLQGAGAFFLLYGCFGAGPVVSGSPGSVVKFPAHALNWIGRHSLSLFLVHQPLVRVLIPAAGRPSGFVALTARLILLLAASAVLALALERITDILVRSLKRGERRWGRRGFAARLASALIVVWGCLIAGELTVRHLAPQEAPDLGWGERPSLESDPGFGWKLRPGQRTRLRWVSYDYQVQANSLGFPGVEYPLVAPPGVKRILVTGDAFTSAEGVDTEEAWPRQLEQNLASSAKSADRHPQVLNFAITGYGPNQYRQVVQHFAPLYHPDVVLIGFFVNDYEDAMTPTSDFQKSIGFGRPEADSLPAILTFRELSSYFHAKVKKAIYQNVLHRPDPDGYFLGQFSALERGPDGDVQQGRPLVREQLQAIHQVTSSLGARLIVMLIPSGPQVCSTGSLGYWPKYTTLTDQKFDPTLPQQTTSTIDRELGIETIDLLPLFRSANSCLYQSHNMHWTASAHRLVASYLTHFFE